ncbi:AAA domain-containing protein, partial [Falsiroseomonas sp. CW058]|uniref:AAA domain-containing protein n=1 Tax=Falsiroseomonas sp. CW058 TaxID=3388664 RepID=UPI003D3155BF
ARPEDPLPALDAALAVQAASAEVRAGDGLGRAAFGALWQGAGSDPAALGALLAWRRAWGPEAAAALAAGLPPVAGETVEGALDAWEVLSGTTALDPLAAFGTDDPDFATLAARLGDWAGAPEALPVWLGWRRAVAEADAALAPLAERLADGRLAPEAALPAFDYALDEALLKSAMRARPELAAFDGAAFDRLVEEFREADRARIDLARREAAWTHAQALARVRAGMAGYTLIRGEMEKKRGHLPVRELLTRAGPAVQAAKPVFMMSPLSVAQFLAPPHGLRPGLTFDLLVIDEASQVEPVDALGAIARCRQVVVVGDDRQMPPTRFFQRMTTEEGEEAPEDRADAPVAAREVESILGLANARGVPNVMLRWHYRSRHESLIATSNAEFYEGRLLVLPSPRARSGTLGLSLVRVDGRWEAGVNRIEAAEVAQAVMRHARETPGDTLGVAAFSLRQRDAILDEVERLRREDPSADAFFAAHPHEPFFVKNLENVQGDERDAILISIAFAKGAEGRVAQRFGPVSAEGGERRLNVLITRARRRCVVFSSITADDIDLERSDGVGGEKALKAFLRFAAEAGGAHAGGEAVAAPLAGVIAEELRALGRDAVARVGTSGLFLDVAAREGDDFVLGVEADAGDWAAVRAARDRERGRAAALGQMGWKLHRAWSLAWLARPEAERARLRAALGAAPQDATPAPAPAGADPGLAPPYAEAAVEVPRDTPIPQVPFARLSEILAAVIRAEQPVHADAVMERARLLWGRDRLDAADRAALQQGLRLAAQLQGVAEAGGFWRAEDAPPVVARDRRSAAPHLRRAAMVAPSEVEAAARLLAGAMQVATEEELAAGVTRLLGLEPAQAPAIAARVAALVGAGAVSLAAGS